MNKTKRVLSFVTSFAMAASAFSALVIPASAEDTPLTPALDTYIADDSTDHSSDSELRVLQASKIALLKFDASELDGTITSATLDINIASRAYNSGRNRWESTGIVVRSVDADWESTVQFSDYAGMSKTTVSNGTQWSENDAETPSDGTAPYHEKSFDVTDVLTGDEDGIVAFAIETSTAREQAIASAEDETYAPTLTITTSDAQTYTITVNNKVDDVTIASYEIEDWLDGSEYTATKAQTGYKVYDGKTYIMQEDADITLNVSSENTVLDIPFVALDDSVVLYEDFANLSDIWGFTAGNQSSIVAGDGYLSLTNYNMTSGDANEYGYLYSDVKEFDTAVSELDELDVTFKWTGNTEGGKNRKNAFELRDSSNNVIFGLVSQAAKGSSDTFEAGVTYQVGAVVNTDSTNIPSSGWTTGDSGEYTISLHLDFTGETGKVSGSIKGGVANADITIPETEITATNLAKIVASDVYSLAPQRLSFFQVAKVDSEEPTPSETTEPEQPTPTATIEAPTPTVPVTDEPEEPSEAQVLINEDFSETTGAWGFEGNGGAGVDEANEYLIINSTNKNGATTVKTFEDNVKSAEALNIKFDWASDVEEGKDRNSAFELRDGSGVLLFAMYGKGGSKTDSGIKYGLVDGTWIDIESHTRDKWFTVELDVNFMMGTMTYKITDRAAGSVLKEDTVEITAENLATMTGNDIYSLAPQWIDNVVISTPATYAVTIVAKDGESQPVEGATVSVVGSEKTAVTNAEGKANLVLGAGTYDIEVTKSGYAIAKDTVEVSGTTEKDITMQYVGEPVATSVEIAGGDEYLYQPKQGETKKSVNAYTATVYDQTGQAMSGASVAWSLKGEPTGASIDQNGIITLTDAYSVTDINGADLTVVATSGAASAEVMIHVRQAQILSEFGVEGPSVIKYGKTATYSIVDPVDQYGVAYGYDDVTYELTATNATVDGMNVTATETDTQVSDIVITAKSSNDKTGSITATGYGYDFYEPGVDSATYAEDARMIDINGENVIAWPLAPGTTYINLPDPVELTPGSAKLIRFKLAETTQSLVAQARTLDFQNKDGVSVLSDGKLYNPNGQLGFNPTYEDKMYGWGEGSKYVGDIGAAGMSTWVDCQILIKTANDGTASVIVDVGGQKVETGIATVDNGEGVQVPITEISRIELDNATGIPENRNLAIKDIIISDSDIAEVEVSGDDQIAKIEGHVATKAYRGAVYTTVDGETFTWSVSGEGTTGGGTTAVTKAVFTLDKAAETDMTAVAVYPVYTDDVLTSLTVKNVEIKAGDTEVSVDAEKDAVVYLWDSLQGMKPLAKQASIETEEEGAADITIDQNGVLSVKDTAKAGTVVTIRYESSASTEDAPRYAEKQVTINDFASVKSFEINGPAAVNAGDTAQYSAVNIIDEYDDEVEMNTVYAITEGSDIASIDPATGVMTTTAGVTGNVVVSVTVGNSGKTSTLTKDVYVGSYSISGTTTEDSIEVDVTKIANYDADTDYYVTTAKDGVIVKQYETKSTDGKVTVDTKDADSYEVSPIYFFDNVGNVASGKEIALADGYYDFTFTKANGTRADIFVNGIMVGQNVDQYGAGRATSGSEYTVTDVKVSGGSAVVTMKDNTSDMKSIRVKKAPTIVERKTHLYILGDSLVSSYYGTYATGENGQPAPGDAQTGWGQQLENFIGDDVNVTNLAESGSDSLTIMNTTYQSVIALSEPGDYVILECGYNDADTNSHAVGSSANMKKYVSQMVADFREAGIIPILVTPNASRHDYKESVKWAGALLEVAADDNVFAVDLSKGSYNFLYGLYGDDTDALGQNFNLYINGATPDNWLHTSYVGAMKYAEIVAQGIADLQASNATAGENGDESLAELTIDKSFTYSFEDTKGNTIDMQVK